MRITRREALLFVAVGSATFVTYRWVLPRDRTDACLRCGPGNHVKYVKYEYIDMRKVANRTQQDIKELLAEDEPESELVVVPMGTDRSSCGPPWRCAKCGRTWVAPHPDPFKKNLVERLWAWLTQ